MVLDTVQLVNDTVCIVRIRKELTFPLGARIKSNVRVISGVGGSSLPLLFFCVSFLSLVVYIG